jgi:hypothetical protein
MTDLEFMKAYDKWPRWPMLPLKKRDDSKICGFLLGTGYPVVYLKNIYGLKQGDTIENLPKQEYDSLQAILDDGWVID